MARICCLSDSQKLYVGIYGTVNEGIYGKLEPHGPDDVTVKVNIHP